MLIAYLDDTVEDLEYCKTMLGDMKGWIVDTYMDHTVFRRAVKLIDYDIILMDINMPGVNGFVFGKRLNHPNIIFYTGQELDFSRELMPDLEHYPMRSKNDSIDGLIKLIEDVKRGTCIYEKH